jgi:hypothetical protein
MKKVKKAVEMAKKYAAQNDHEYAHAFEKDAWEAALTAIAQGAPNAQFLAQKALETRELDFARWFA